MWYRFSGSNLQAQYGWTRDPAVAEAALATLNRGRDINLYYLEELGADTDHHDGMDLSQYASLLCDDDTTVADYQEEADPCAP